MTAPTLESIKAAYAGLADEIHRTPLISSRSLAAFVGTDLRLKLENLQVTGSFKIRGAFTKLAQLHRQGVQGVVTASSGNHGQAVAWSARYFGLPARIVVPKTAPALKVAAAEGYGALVERCGTTSKERLERAQELAESLGYVFVPPYDDAAVMSGQGTVGLEIFEDWPEVDTVLVPIGGGGLISGVATALKSLNADIRVIGVEPEGASKAYTSRQEGHRVELPRTKSLADGLITLALGHFTHPIIEQHVDQLVTVSDREIQEAFWFLFTRLKLVAEPSGVATLAYALRHAEVLKNRRVVCVVSGGNVDPAAIGPLQLS